MLTVVYDACVLYPAPLRDLLMRLARTGLFRARWSDAIHDEWIAAVLEKRPDLEHRLKRTRALMDQHVLDGLVSDYEHLVSGLKLPDEDDRHVLAAAIQCGADVIVTFNLRDFPGEYLRQYGIEAQHPDAFVCGLLEMDRNAVCEAVRRQRASLKHPPRSVDELLATFERQHLTQCVKALRGETDHL